MKRDSVVIYRNLYEAMQNVSERSYKKIMNAILKYSMDGEESNLSGMEKAIFDMAKTQIDANNKRYENGKKGAEGGRLGGRPKKVEENIEIETPNKPHRNPTETPNKPLNVKCKMLNVKCNLKEEDKEEKSSSIKDVDISLQNFLDDFNISLDSYSSDIYEIDFEKLHTAFEKSEWLKKNITSFSKVCALYPKIISGYYNDYVEVDEIILPQERWCKIEKILRDMKYNSQNFNSQYDDYDVHRAKQLTLYDGLTLEEKAYFGDYNSFYNLLEYKSYENEKARFMRDFEKFVKKWRKKSVAS